MPSSLEREEAEEPAAPAETAAPVEEPQARLAAADSILAKFNAAIAERDAALSEVAAYKAKFEDTSKLVEVLRAEIAADRESLGRLERSFGLAAAQVVPVIEQTPATPASIYDQWKNATGAEKTRIFRANRKALEAHSRCQI